MDLGCIDMGCVEKQKKESSSTTTPQKEENSPKESVMSASKLGRNNRAKDAVRSSINALTKLTSQISKPPRRKTSPLNWFPRKKVEPYLKRKIKMLQEVDGMHSTLDETLGDSNPHYSKVLREKMAIREAAQKSMEARKTAMVEASWCRILQAARIESKEAEARLTKADAAAVEAFEAARAIGVIMNDIAGCTEKDYRIETSAKGGGSTTHTVSATFETAFEVDKQVASAVKAAFIQLANCPSIDKDEFKELLRKISENPEADENFQDYNSECESDAGSEVEIRPFEDSADCQDSTFSNKESAGARQRKQKKGQNPDMFNMPNIVEMMLGRLRCLKEDELASLATIVATCGLSAALAESQISVKSDVSSALENVEKPRLKDQSRTSIGGRTARDSFTDMHARRTADAELPSLDKFLVKRMTRLEREVLEAKNARKNEATDGSELKLDVTKDEESVSRYSTSSRTNKLKQNDTVPDLGSMLLKHSSKLEKEIEEARRQNAKSSEANNTKFQGARTIAKQEAENVPSLDKYLVKHLTRLEREVQEARNKKNVQPIDDEGRVMDSNKTANFLADASDSEQISFSPDGDSLDKENLDMNKIGQSNTDASLSPVKIVTEQDHLLQGKNNEEPLSRGTVGVQKHLTKQGGHNEESYESLDKVLVKHVSKLEREKLEFSAGEPIELKSKRKGTNRELESSEGSLDQVLVKHKSRLEREKMAAAEKPDKSIRHSVSRRQAREKELQEAWGGLSLGTNREVESSEGSLDQVLVKHKSRLEREKMAAAEKPDESINHSVSRRQAREKELQEAWGGLSLGNSIRPHVSRLQRDKAAWIKAEEEERKREVGEV